MKSSLTYIFAGEESTSKRSVNDDFDSELSGSLQEADFLVLDFGGERRELDLNDRNRVHGVCTAKGFGADLREPKVLDLTRPVARSR